MDSMHKLALRDREDMTDKPYFKATMSAMYAGNERPGVHTKHSSSQYASGTILQDHKSAGNNEKSQLTRQKAQGDNITALSSVTGGSDHLRSCSEKADGLQLLSESDVKNPPALLCSTGARAKVKDEYLPENQDNQGMSGKGQRISVTVSYYVSREGQKSSVFTIECTLEEYMRWEFIMQSANHRCQIENLISKELKPLSFGLCANNCIRIYSTIYNVDDVKKLVDCLLPTALSQGGLKMLHVPVEKSQVEICLNMIKMSEFGRNNQVFCEIIGDALFCVYSARNSEISNWVNSMFKQQSFKVKMEYPKLLKLVDIQEVLRRACGSENLQVRLLNESSSVFCILDGSKISVDIAGKKLSDLEKSIIVREILLNFWEKESLCELELEEPVNEILRRESINCVVGQIKNKIYVYGFDTDAVQKARVLISRMVNSRTVILSGNQRNPSFVDSIVREYGGKVLVIHSEYQNSQLNITGLSEAVDKAYDGIQQLVSGHSSKDLAPQTSFKYVMKESTVHEYFSKSLIVAAEMKQNRLSISMHKEKGEYFIKLQGDVNAQEKCKALVKRIENDFRCEKWLTKDINACNYFLQREGKAFVTDCAVKNDIIIQCKTTFCRNSGSVKEIDECLIFPTKAVRQKVEWLREDGKRRIVLQPIEMFKEDTENVVNFVFLHLGTGMTGRYCVTVPHWDETGKEAMTSTVLNTLFSQIDKGSFDSLSLPVDPELDWPHENFASRIALFAADVFFCARERLSLSVYLVMNIDKNFDQVAEYVQEAIKTCGEAEEERMTEHSRKRERTKVSIVPGELDNIEVDAIVNTTSPDLILSNGRVSAKLLKKAGTTLQDECKAKYPSGIKPDQIAVTGGYMLPCRQVFHIALKRYNEQKSRQQLGLIKCLVLHCLKTASTDGLRSVAFPALGTGNLQYPLELVARAMFDGVEQFRREVRDSQLQKVLFVIYHKDSAVLQAFKTEEQRWEAEAANPIITSIAEFELRGLKDQVYRVKQTLDAKYKDIQDDAEEVDSKEIFRIEREHYVGLKYLCKKKVLDLEVDIAYESSRLKVTGKRKVLDQAVVEIRKLLKKIQSDECHFVPVKQIERKVIEMNIGLINKNQKETVCVYDDEMEVVLVFGKAGKKVAHKLGENMKGIRAESTGKKGPTQEESSLQSRVSGDGTQPSTDGEIFQDIRIKSTQEKLGPGSNTKEHDGEVPGSRTTLRRTIYNAGTLKVFVYQGDILEVQADCLVNPANGELQHDGGLALQIAQCCGKKLTEESEQIRKRRGGPLQVTEIEVTSGFKFFAKILHAVGPCWSKYEPLTEESVDRCAKDLQSTIQNCLRKTDELKMFSIALPTDSSGLFCVPIDLCAHAYAKAIVDFSQEQSNRKEIHMVDNEEKKIAVINEIFTAIIERKEKLVIDSKRYIQAPDAERLNKKNNCSGKPSERETSVDTDHVSHEVEAVRFCKSKGKSCYMFSETLRMYVYSGDIVQSKGIDAVVCVENRRGLAEDIITKQLSDKGGKEYIEQKKTKFQSCKDNDVFVTEGGETQFKNILHLVVPQTGIKDLQAMYKKIFSSIPRLEIFSAAVNLLQADDTQSGTENSALSLWTEWMQFCRDTKDSDNLFLLHIILPDAEQEDRVKKIFGKQFAGKKEESGEKNSSRVAPKLSLVNQTEVPASMKHVSMGASATKASQDEEENCVICMDKINKEEKLKCGHVFCKECIESYFQVKKVCPTCGKVCGVIYGDQPDGTMTIVKSERSLEGYKGCGTVAITYQFEGGNQRPDHPCPGSAYKGIERTAYLPDNREGREICAMLTVAFERRLVFTIGRSRTTGLEGVITWNDIHHKTNPKPNSQFGYPDPTYLQRVREELEVKGVTKDDIDPQLMKRLEGKLYREVVGTGTYV